MTLNVRLVLPTMGIAIGLMAGSPAQFGNHALDPAPGATTERYVTVGHSLSMRAAMLDPDVVSIGLALELTPDQLSDEDANMLMEWVSSGRRVVVGTDSVSRLGGVPVTVAPPGPHPDPLSHICGVRAAPDSHPLIVGVRRVAVSLKVGNDGKPISGGGFVPIPSAMPGMPGMPEVPEMPGMDGFQWMLAASDAPFLSVAPDEQVLLGPTGPVRASANLAGQAAAPELRSNWVAAAHIRTVGAGEVLFWCRGLDYTQLDGPRLQANFEAYVRTRPVARGREVGRAQTTCPHCGGRLSIEVSAD